MSKNKKWKREAKRIQGECFKHFICCEGCKYLFKCINKMWWGGNSIGIREAERRIKEYNMDKKKEEVDG